MRETVFALSSGSGRAGIAVFRISGSLVRDFLIKSIGVIPHPRVAKLCAIRDASSAELIDTGLVLFFPAPHSFTGEDLAELHIHGSIAVIRRLSSCLAQFGLKPASAGEFSKRAYDSGKMDFLDLETLSDLLAAETELQRKLAIDGNAELRRVSLLWRDQLLSLCAEVQAHLDFSDEGDVPMELDSDVKQSALRLADVIDSYTQQAPIAKRIREGFRIALLGAPNSGKSTLLNALAGRNVAIISDQPGTTRDVIEVHLDLDGYPIILFDTAGICQSNDEIEQEGIDRAKALSQQVDLTLWLSRVDDPKPSPDQRFVTVITHIDRHVDFSPSSTQLALSAKTGEGIEQLLNFLKNYLQSHMLDGAAPSIVAHERQVHQLHLASSRLRAAFMYPPSQLEFAAEDLRQACLALDTLTGRIQTEDILGAIFSRFCIGK